MQEFIGLEIQITLLNSQIVKGTVTNINPSAQLLTLTNVVCTDFSTNSSQVYQTFQVNGSQIKDLVIVGTPTPMATPIPIPVHVPTPVPIQTPVKETKKQESSKTPEKFKEYKRNAKSKKAQVKQTFEEIDAQEINQDFDFQGSLSRFDKAAVFQEIRESDSTAPESRLVSHNKRQDLQRKLGIHENVLETREEVSSADELSNGRKRFMSLTGLPVACISVSEMMEIERIAVTETGPNEEQMIENAGRTAAMLSLQALGGNRRIRPGNHNDKPLVVVLAGNNRIGSYALATARHLSNHDCTVLVCLQGNEAELVNTVAYQRKIFLATGGTLIKSHSELPKASQPVDFIIDGLLGSVASILDMPTEIEKLIACQWMLWANENKASILSLDMPSGLDSMTGQPLSPSHAIQSKYVLAFGLPKWGLLHVHGAELFLGDIGIPKCVYQRVLKNVEYVAPFGDKFIVGLIKKDS